MPFPHPEMPDDVKEIYIEARTIFPKSSIAAAALLQLATEMLMLELNYDGRNLHELIDYLEKKEIPGYVKKGLEPLRSYRNRGVIHMKKMNLKEEEIKEKVSVFFEILNVIVEESIMFLRENKKTNVLEAHF